MTLLYTRSSPVPSRAQPCTRRAALLSPPFCRHCGGRTEGPQACQCEQHVKAQANPTPSNDLR